MFLGPDPVYKLKRFGNSSLRSDLLQDALHWAHMEMKWKWKLLAWETVNLKRLFSFVQTSLSTGKLLRDTLNKVLHDPVILNAR